MFNFFKFFAREASRHIIIVVALGGVAALAFAFTEPSVGPTGGTVNAPVNTGNIAQTKQAGLTLNPGQLWASTIVGNTRITVNGGGEYCIGTSCITAWPAAGGSSVGAAGTVQFGNGSGGFNGDAANFFWDNTNDRLGIRTSVPSTNLHVVGGARVTNLASCNTIDTDALGNFMCGIDDTGAGGAQNLQQVTDVGYVTTRPLRSINSVSGAGQVMIGIDESSRRLLIDYNALDFASIQGGIWGGVARPVILNGGGGNVGIGTANPGAKLEVAGQIKITGGAPGAGKVLTSDAAGLASWVLPSGGGGAYDNGNWIVATRIDENSLPIGTSILAPVPNGWTVGTVVSWMQSIATTWGWKLAYNYGAFLENQAVIQGSWDTTTCNAVPPAVPTNRPCLYVSAQYGMDRGGWANNGTGILVTTAKKLGIGTTNPGAGLEINTDVIPLRLRNTTSAAGQYWLVGPNNLNAFQVINQGGVGMFMNNGTPSWTGTSDMRLKENVSSIPDALQKVLRMRGVTYNFKGNDKRDIGVIAQEVQPYFPELVSAGPNGYLGVSYDRLAPILIEAIKEQQKEIESLKARVEALEKK